jgi:hypothetical protein
LALPLGVRQVKNLQTDFCPKDNEGIDPGRAPSREVQARKRHAAEYFRNFNAAGL